MHRFRKICAVTLLAWMTLAAVAAADQADSKKSTTESAKSKTAKTTPKGDGKGESKSKAAPTGTDQKRTPSAWRPGQK